MYGCSDGSLEGRMALLIPEARDAWANILKGEFSLEELIDSIKHNPPEGENEAFSRAYIGLAFLETAPILFQERNIMGELSIDSILRGKAEVDGPNHLVAVKMLDGTIHFVEGLPD